MAPVNLSGPAIWEHGLNDPTLATDLADLIWAGIGALVVAGVVCLIVVLVVAAHDRPHRPKRP